MHSNLNWTEQFSTLSSWDCFFFWCVLAIKCTANAFISKFPTDLWRARGKWMMKANVNKFCWQTVSETIKSLNNLQNGKRCKMKRYTIRGSYTLLFMVINVNGHIISMLPITFRQHKHADSRIQKTRLTKKIAIMCVRARLQRKTQRKKESEEFTIIFVSKMCIRRRAIDVINNWLKTNANRALKRLHMPHAMEITMHLYSLQSRNIFPFQFQISLHTHRDRMEHVRQPHKNIYVYTHTHSHAPFPSRQYNYAI